VWDGIVADWRTAPVGEGLMAVLVLLEKLTLRPDELRRDDLDAVLGAGVSEPALRDAIKVCALFNMIVRMADSLGWDVPPPAVVAQRAPKMLEGGYALSAIAAR
jgi:alkylhydroperoxidase family enzyme